MIRFVGAVLMGIVVEFGIGFFEKENMEKERKVKWAYFKVLLGCLLGAIAISFYVMYYAIARCFEIYIMLAISIFMTGCGFYLVSVLGAIFRRAVEHRD